MDLKINKSLINKIEYLSFLHDKIANNIIKTNKTITILFSDDFENLNQSYKMTIDYDKNILDYINTYEYTFHNGKIKGKVTDFSDYLDSNFSFQVIDIGYKYSTLFIKGSIIKNKKLSGNIIIEFSVDSDDFVFNIEKL